MSELSRFPPPPRQSPYGWPLPDRREEFRKLARTPSGETYRVADFKGDTITLPILRVPLNLAKYRIANGRTASAQQEWAAAKRMDADFFDQGDPELEDVQIAQHLILKGMVKDEGLLNKFKDSANKQVDPLLLDENGFVVNGSRRMCCWRMLHADDASAFGHFSHIDVVVLPHCDEQELDRLEAKLQIEKDIRSNYSWDAEAAMLAKKQKLHNFTTPQLAQLYGKGKKEIEDLLSMRHLAAEYLRSRGKENAWSEVTGDRFAFLELLKAMSATTSQSDKEIIKQASFALIDDSSDAGGRLYEVVPKVREHLTAIKESLADAFPLPSPEEDQIAEEAFGVGTASNAPRGKPSGLALVAEMKKDVASAKKARAVVIETIRSQDEQNREKDAADFLFKTLKKANILVQSAFGHGLRPESSTLGVLEQLEAMRAALDRIEAWVSAKRG
jgi:hypothetical protein